MFWCHISFSKYEQFEGTRLKLLLLPHEKYILPPGNEIVSAFSAFLFLFEAISKNLPRTHINLHYLIPICLEILLSISFLHSHTDVLLYWYLSELKPSCIYSTPFEMYRVYHIHENYPPPNCILFQDVRFLWFSMFSGVKCVSVVIPRQQ